MDGAVVVLYNPDDEDYFNIASYAGTVDITYIVDNSKKSNFEKIEKILNIDGNRVIYEHHPENIGLCKGMNIGINRLKDRGCSWAFTMNSDSYFKNDVVTIFREFVDNNDCSDIAMLVPLYNFDRHIASEYKGTKEIKRAMMSGNYINIEIFNKLNGFLEVLFVDGLDNDYCIRCNRNKYKIIECGNAVMEHKPCKTAKKNILGIKFKYGYDSPKRYYGHARSLAFLTRRYKTLYELSFLVYKFLKILFLFDNKKDYITNYINGAVDGFRAEKETRV